MDIESIKNFLDKDSFKDIEEIFFSYPNYFPWYLGPGKSFEGDGHLQFVHLFFSENKINSSDFTKLDPILKILKPKTLIRIKANLLSKTDKIIEHPYHIDCKDCKTAIFYINTNNGFTKFKNGKTINSEKNKLIKFNSNLKHGGTTCTDTNVRIVINFNYE